MIEQKLKDAAPPPPDPRFRDQLAEDLAEFIASYTRGERAWARMSDTARDIYRSGAKNFVVDALLPLIAAEVARHQAAELGEALGIATTSGPLDAVAWMARRHADLAGAGA